MGFFSGLVQFFGLQSKKPIVANYADPGTSTKFKAAIVHHQLVYGQLRIEGMKYEVGSTGVRNTYRHVVIVLAGHELDSIGNIIMDGVLINGTPTTPGETAHIAKLAPYIRVSRHTGGSGQVSDPDLIAEFPVWDSTAVGNGLAYVYIRFKYNASLFPNGVGAIEVDVRGRKVLDPRNQSVAWSDNWALCMRDYLTADFGMGLLDSEIDDSFTIASANTSEEIIATANGGSQNRYTINGVVDTKNSVTNNIKKLLTAGAGVIVPSIEGKTRIHAGAYATPTVTITASDLRGDVTYKAKGDRASLFNTVSGSFSGEESYWKKVTYPQIGDPAAVAADGRVLRKVIDLPYCTDHERCQRLSTQVLRQHRASATMTLPCKATVKEVATMDVVNVAMPLLWSGTKTFRVSDMTMNKDMTADLHLVEDNANIYAWQQSDALPFVPIVPPPTKGGGIVQPGIPVRVNGLELSGQANNTEFTGPDAHFVWRHITAFDFQEIGSEVFGAGSGGFDSWFQGYEIRILDGTTVVRTDFTTQNTYIYSLVQNSTDIGGPRRAFAIEVRIKGQQNQLSQPAKLSVSNPPPALPGALSTIAGFDNIHITFANPADLDYAGVLVHMSTVSGFTVDASTLVHDGRTNDIILSGLLAATNYYLRLTLYDDFGKAGAPTTSEIVVSTTQVAGSVIEPGSLDYILFLPAIATNIQNVPGVIGTANTAITNAAAAQVTANGAAATASSTQAAVNDPTTGLAAVNTNLATVTNTANGAAATAASTQAAVNDPTTGLAAVSTNLATVTNTANGAAATASQSLVATQTIDGQLAASYAVRLDTNGYVAGFGLTNGGNAPGNTGAQFTVLADRFRFVNAAGNLQAAAFAVDGAGNAVFTGNLLAAGGTFAGVLSAAGGTFTGVLSAATMTGGSINIGGNFSVDSAGNTIIKSASTGGRLEIKNNVIKVFDAAGVVRVQIGDLTV